MSLFQPLNIQVPIVDPKTGRPTPQFQRLMQELGLAAGLTVENGEIGLDDGGVTNAKLADMAAKTIKARKEATGGAPQDCTISEVLDFIAGAAHGSIIYRDSSDWQVLAPGSAGQFLVSNGPGANPAWASGGGGMQIVSAVANDAQATTADNQYVSKHGSAFNGAANSANNLSVTFTIGSAQTVQAHFFAILNKIAGTQRHAIYNSSGTKIWPVFSSGDPYRNMVYGIAVGEGNGYRVEFVANVALAAGTYTWVVRSEYAIGANNATYYDRNFSVLYTP